MPLIDQKTKALITIAVDVVNQGYTGSSNPFAAHVNMALKQGITRAEIEELLLFMCVYAGFNKAAGCFGTLNEIFEQRDSLMSSNQNDKSKLDRYLQVVQFVSERVHDMAKNLEFYTDVMLRGKLAIAEMVRWVIGCKIIYPKKRIWMRLSRGLTQKIFIFPTSEM